MSTRDRGRQQSFRTRLLSWAGTAPAPQRGPSQRQPSRVTTTAAQPQSPEAQDQPPLPPQPRQQLPLPGAPAPPPSRRPSQPPPSMGTAPSRPAPETRSPATARGPPSPPPTDAAPPRSQPPSRTPSRQLSRTYTQPPSPSGPLPQSQAAVPRGPSPSPSRPTVSPAQPALPAEPKAPSTTPPQPPTPPPAASTPPSSPAKAPSPQPQPAPVLEIPAAPPMSPPPTTAPGSPATTVQELQPPPTEQMEQAKEEEAAATTPPTKLQPQETPQEKHIDLALMPIELRKRPVPEAEDKTISTESPTIPHPAPETPPDRTEDQLPPTKEVDMKQTSDTTEPPEPEPERIEEEKPVLRPEADQDGVPTLPKDTERKLGKTEGEKRTVAQPELFQEEDPSRSKTIETKPEGFREETPKTSPVPTPDEQPQIKDSQETTTMVETMQTTDEQPQAKDSQETTNMVGTKQTSKEPYQKPIQIHTQPIREVKLSEAEQPEKQPPPPEKEPAAPPSVTKGKEGKIAISTVARSPTTSREQSGGLHKEIKEGISRLVQNLAVQHTKQTGSGHDISIITLAGDNHGASMYVGYSTTAREGSNVHVHKGPLPSGGGGGGAANGEDGQKKTDQQLSNTATATSSTSVNSNVQTINNSILQDSCCSEENPGVHLVISSKPPGLAQQEEMAKPAQLQKHRTRLPLLPWKGAHEPNVRRRCLRALFLEPSDDDAEKPQRPRRHGCRFGCGDEKNAKGEQDGAAKGRDA